MKLTIIIKETLRWIVIILCIGFFVWLAWNLLIGLLEAEPSNYPPDYPNHIQGEFYPW